MSSELRRRMKMDHHAGIMEGQDQDSIHSAGLSVENLMRTSPSQTGPAWKLHIPVIYMILPTCCQSILRRWFPSVVAPSWKSRYLIQVGGYLYKFVNDVSSSSPKGSPIAVDEIVDVHVVPQGQYLEDGILSSLPDADGYFVITTVWKRQYYAVPTAEDSRIWVETLRQARQEAITRKMGHARDQPYPYNSLDRQACGLVNSKRRIRAQIQTANWREMELVAMGAGGNSTSRGYPA
jgi:hypothetical protein